MHADEIEKVSKGWQEVLAILGFIVLLSASAFTYGYLKGQKSSQPAIEAAKAHGVEVIQDASKREAEAKRDRDQYAALAADRGSVVEQLQAKLARLSAIPEPKPVDSGVSNPVTLAELAKLGLHPVGLPAPLVVGLDHEDAIATINWGLEAQQMGRLVERLDTCQALNQAQEGEKTALLRQVDSLTTALNVCDERAMAQAGQAKGLEVPRPWRIGFLAGRDLDDRNHIGAYVGWSYKALDLQVIAINKTAALGAGFRF